MFEVIVIEKSPKIDKPSGNWTKKIARKITLWSRRNSSRYHFYLFEKVFESKIENAFYAEGNSPIGQTLILFFFFF